MRADAWGPIGSAIAAACCLGLAPVVSALTAAGLGFLIRDAILLPLLALFLAATLWQLHRDRRRHRVMGPVALGWAGAALTAAGIWLQAAVVGLGLTILVARSARNLALGYRLRRPMRAGGGEASRLASSRPPEAR